MREFCHSYPLLFMASKMNTDKTIDVEDLQEFLPDESSPFTYTAATDAADAEAEDPVQNFASSSSHDRVEGDDASAHEEVLSAVSFGNIGSNDRPVDSGGNDDEERSFDEEVEGIIRHIHSDETVTTMTQSTSARDFAERTLPEDTFSFLIYTDVFSSCFLLGIMVFLFQLAIYAVLLYDIIDSGKKITITKKNLFGFPFNVEAPVRIAEVIAIFISIITQQDVRKAICIYRDGFDESGLTQVFKGATIYKWWLSIVLRAWEGGMGLFVTFLLIMRSDSVLELLLNFSAIEFITMLDDVLFELASEGFLGRALKKETKRLSRKSYYVSHEHANSYSAMIVSIAYFVVLFTSFFAGWFVIYENQRDGLYACQRIFSQFGAEVLPILGTFTGLFIMHSEPFDDRPRYRGIGTSDKEIGPLLAYCKDQERWTLSLTKNGTNAKKWDPCKDWFAASSESQSFDLLSTTSSPWIIKNIPTKTKGGAPFTNPFMACYECKNVDVVNFCGEHGKCVPGVEAKFDSCSCNDGYYGLRCDYFEPCQVLEVSQRDESFRSFPKGIDRYFASKYYRVIGAEPYYRPTYTSLNESLRDEFDVILFTGDRWIMSYNDLLSGLKDVHDTLELVNYFIKFRGYDTNYSVVYESELVYTSELLDADVKASLRSEGDFVDSAGANVKASSSPLSIRWHRSSSEGDFVKSELYCTQCNNQTNPCFNEGVCLSNSICKCLDGYSGSRCEKSPISLSDGKCDFEFNKEEYGFDGGDCCEDTCRSTLENICGKTEQGYIDIGYPFCKRQSNQWNVSGDAIYGVSTASRSGYVVALGGRGTILAVADPEESIVRVFDKDGAEWKQRGQYIQGPFGSHFGSVMSLSLSSDESDDIAHNPLTSSKVILAVGTPKIGLVRVFSCSTDGCIQRGDDMNGSGRFGNSVSVDGDIIAIRWAETALNGEVEVGSDVKVLIWSNNKWMERGSFTSASQSLRKLSDPSDYSWPQGYHVSLSGDYVAVGTLAGDVSSDPSPSFESVKLITQVFKYNKSTGVWGQLGDEIEKQPFFDDASVGTPWPLKAVVIKGSVLAIGSKNSADVYSWNDASKEWSQREVDLATGPEGSLGWSVDLSVDANILAIGSNVENLQPTDKSIRMYQWDGKSYKVLSNGIPAGPGASLSLSSDGKAVAVGLPFDSSNGGSTRVYNFYSTSPCNDCSEKSLRISFTTDSKPEETTWELRVDSKLKRSSGSLSGHAYTTFVEEICVPVESCVRFLVCGTQGDWLESPGVFALMLDDKVVVRASNFGSYDVTNYCEGATLPPSAHPSVTQPPTSSPPAVTQPPTPSPPVVTQPPTPSPTAVTQPPTPSPATVTQPPTASPRTVTQPPTPSPPKTCEDGSDRVRIEVTLGEQPSDSYWDLRDERDDEKIIVVGRYDMKVKDQRIVTEVCKPREDCYLFRLSTTDASALVYLNGKEIAKATTECEIKIGDSCC